MTNNEKLPQDWKLANLGVICKVNPTRPKNLMRTDDELTTFVPMAAVDDQSGTIVERVEKPFGALKKGYTYFEEGDVLFAKITPCMENGKHAIATDLLGGFGFGTTEFHVLRPNEDVLAAWVHMYLRQPDILKLAATHFTGSVGQQRVPPDFLASLLIPLPPLPEQRRIMAAIEARLGEVERARAAVQSQRDAADALMAAHLRAVFEGEEARGWDEEPLSDLASIRAQLVDPTRSEYRNLPHINGENMESGTGRLGIIRTAAEDKMESGKYLFQPQDVLYSKIRPYLRKAAYVDFIGLCSADVYPITVNKELLDARFLMWHLLAAPFSRYADGQSRRARMPKLNREQLFAWKMPLPELSEQQAISAMLEVQQKSIDNLLDTLQEQQDFIDRLPSAILRQAFAGEF